MTCSAVCRFLGSLADDRKFPASRQILRVSPGVDGRTEASMTRPHFLPLPILACALLGPACPARELTSEATQLSVVGDGRLSFRSRISHPLRLADRPQELFLHVDLQADVAPDMPRPRLSLALVIDRSGSMASENKLQYAQSAAEQLVQRLHPEDRLALISYDDVVRVEVPLAAAGNSEPFLAAIRALVPGSSTNLCGGMVAGIEELQRDEDVRQLRRVVLLSDGLANRGVTEPAAIAARAAHAADGGVYVTTMGLGLEYDEELLSGVAQESGGSYYYVDAPESVGRFLDQELEELTRVTARDLEVRLELGEDVELVELFGHAYRLEGRAAVIGVRDMFAGQRRKLVVRLRSSGRLDESRSLASCSLHYVDAATGAARQLVEPELVARFTADAREVEQSRNLEVLAQAEVVQNAIALDRAMKLQKSGDYAGAQELLAARYLNSRSLNEAELQSEEVSRTLRRIKQVLEDLERTRNDPRARRDLQLATELRALGYAGN
jgi:Ca-activated chloride channel family protein